MKEQMKKITFLVFHREKEKVLQEMQEAGIFHLEVKNIADAASENLIAEKVTYQKAIDIITNTPPQDISGKKSFGGDPEELRNITLELQDQKEKAEAQIDAIEKEQAQLQPWGKFDRQHLQRLKENNIEIDFYIATKKQFRQFNFEEYNEFVISEVRSNIYFVVVNDYHEDPLPFDKVQLPASSYNELNLEIDKLRQRISEIELQIAGYLPYLAVLKEEILKIEDSLSKHLTDNSFDSLTEGSILHIQGWYPVNKEQNVESFLMANDLSYLIENPEAKDKVPVILNNKGISKRFEPITKIFQLPDYYEFDLTPIVAVFYPIFFAYCLGDSGYGIILIIFSFIARSTFLKNNKIFAELGIILGFVSALLGILVGGTFLGIPILNAQDIPVFAWLSQFVLVPEDPSRTFNTFNVALMIGLFQIILGVVISIIKKFRQLGFVYSLAAFGKLFIIISLVSIFLGSMQGVPVFVPYVDAAWLILATGVILVLFFHDPQVPILKRIGGGVLPLYFIVTNLLGDSLSYIRLFAIGVASAILGLVVNQIGGQIIGHSIFSIIGGVIFLIFGHSLNLALACLGAFVHPLRLTFVEFYMNADFKGGGVPYNPFKKQFITDKK